MQPLIGKTFSHYRILSEIGRGGMGVVYKAEDTKLDRLVAIKFLPAAVGDSRSHQRRFINEARAACRLDSRNICTIHQIDETEAGELYIVMAYYEGEPLSRRIGRGPLPLEDCASFTMQIANGLATAHEAGVVHRDIKPANVVITTKGDVKILDFGLAKMLHGAVVTTSHASAGTPAYMAPEQVRAEVADHRCDIWALGAVVYEMMTGRRPFRGDTGQVVMYQILHAEPEPVSKLRPEAPAAFLRLLERALTKDRDKRYQTVGELIQEFDPYAAPTFISPQASAGPPPIPSILVLPFDNLSAKDEDDYFAEGLSDEVITDLSALDSIRVISRTSASQLKESGQNVRSMAQGVGAQYIVEGSVRKQGDAFRINAKLIDAGEDHLLWAEKYRGQLEDVFEIQETISRKIVDALSLKLKIGEKKKLGKREIGDYRAFDRYLRAKQEMLRYSKESLDRALQFLQSSAEIEKDNVMLTAAIGQVYWQYVNAGITANPDYLAKARQYAEKAQELDAESPHAYRLMGLVRIHEGDGPGAVALLRKALELDPNDIEALSWSVSCCGYLGRVDIAREYVTRLLEIDPLTPIYQCLPGFLSIMEGDYPAAVAPMKKGHSMDPGNPMIRLTYAQVLGLAGEKKEASRLVEQIEADQPDSFHSRMGRLLFAALEGNLETAREALSPQLQEGARGDPQYAWNVGQALALLGEADEAIDWIDQAVKLGFINYPLLSEKDPCLNSLHDLPRYQSLMEQVKERWEALEL